MVKYTAKDERGAADIAAVGPGDGTWTRSAADRRKSKPASVDIGASLGKIGAGSGRNRSLLRLQSEPAPISIRACSVCNRSKHQSYGSLRGAA